MVDNGVDDDSGLYRDRRRTDKVESVIEGQRRHIDRWNSQGGAAETVAGKNPPRIVLGCRRSRAVKARLTEVGSIQLEISRAIFKSWFGLVQFAVRCCTRFATTRSDEWPQVTHRPHQLVRKQRRTSHGAQRDICIHIYIYIYMYI